ncbi:outer membrane protein [Alkalilacustris brevis]|uniref:outer membrane protein n=1 Tax=Alkalilacustris brevis TaxID=2026338 RepID=UPI000E0D7745|nr:outer membrane beta-barrel protein [Alkalilacustris brevis]
MKKLYVALLASAIAAPAFAGSPTAPLSEPVIQPAAPAPVARARDWTGFYGGAQLGYGNVKSPNGSGAIGGVHLGYLHDFGGFAAGAELDLNAARLSLDQGGRLDELHRLKLRGGATFDNVFVYGVAGYAYASTDSTAALGSDNGWLGGIGAEVALDNNWRVGGEILHHRLRDFNGGTENLSTTTAQVRTSFRF